MSQIAKFMGPTWGPPGSCRPQPHVGPRWAHVGPTDLAIRALCCRFQDWGINAYKDLHLKVPGLGMCVADSIMFYDRMDYEEAARKVIEAEAEVGRYMCVNRCKITVRSTVVSRTCSG